MIQIQIIYDEPSEKEIAEFYRGRILEEHIATLTPVVVVLSTEKRSRGGAVSMKMCKINYPYSCIGDDGPCTVCGHLGKDHVFRNGVSVCKVCVESDEAGERRA